MASELGTFLKAISLTKDPVLKNNEPLVAVYNQYVINRCLSYFSDSILLVNEMNTMPETDPMMHFDFLKTSLRPRKRFERTTKPEGPNEMEQVLVCAFPSYSLARIRREIMPLVEHDSDLFDNIKAKTNRGGKTSNHGKKES